MPRWLRLALAVAAATIGALVSGGLVGMTGAPPMLTALAGVAAGAATFKMIAP